MADVRLVDVDRAADALADLPRWLWRDRLKAGEYDARAPVPEAIPAAVAPFLLAYIRESKRPDCLPGYRFEATLPRGKVVWRGSMAEAVQAVLDAVNGPPPPCESCGGKGTVQWCTPYFLGGPNRFPPPEEWKTSPCPECRPSGPAPVLGTVLVVKEDRRDG